MVLNGINGSTMKSNAGFQWGSAATQRIGLLNNASQAASIYEQHVAQHGHDPDFYESIMRPIHEQDKELSVQMNMREIALLIADAQEENYRKAIKENAKKYSF